MSNTVAKATKTQEADIKAVKKIRDLMGGTDRMREAAETYLAKEKAEKKTEYDARISRAYLFNALKKTVNDYADKVFSKEIKTGQDTPDEIAGLFDADGAVTTEGYIENFDMDGQSLNTFAHEALRDALQTGLNFFLVEMPQSVGEDGTLADEQRPGFRPFCTMIRKEDVLGWKTEVRFGVKVLTQFRFIETVNEIDPEDEFSVITSKQVRVYDLDELSNCFWRTFRESDDNKGDWELHEEGTISLEEIPVVPFYADRKAFFRGNPVLEELADLNIAHWQSTADQKNILHVVRVPMLFAKGFAVDEKGEFVASVGRMTMTNDKEADLKWVEHQGKGIESGDKDLKNLEFMMQAFGLSLILPKANGATATGESIDNAKSNSALGMMADGLKDALENVFFLMAKFKNPSANTGGSVIINKEYGFSLNTVDSQVLLGLYNSGLLRGEVVIKELQRRGVLSDDIDAEAEAALAEDLDDIEPANDPELDDEDDDPSQAGSGGFGSNGSLDNILNGFEERLRAGRNGS